MAYDLISPETVVVPGYHTFDGVGSALINTLVVVSLPPGYGIVFRSRSSLASKRGITVEAGEIDSDYRGLLKVLLYNHNVSSYKITAGDRIAQARIVKIHELQDGVSYEYPDPDETARGAGGFGSTGK
jgi:dUTP pyrophosphatase